MKIIEAIKEFPLIVKKMQANAEKIQQYASSTSFAEDMPFGTPEGQKREVASLVQANLDLHSHYMHLVRSLAYTNTQVIVAIGGEHRSIVEWLHVRGAGKISAVATEMLAQTYKCLNTSTANAQLRTNQKADISEKPLQVFRFYDQKDADAKLAALSDLRAVIDSKLEVVNATTELMEIN